MTIAILVILSLLLTACQSPTTDTAPTTTPVVTATAKLSLAPIFTPAATQPPEQRPASQLNSPIATATPPPHLAPPPTAPTTRSPDLIPLRRDNSAVGPAGEPIFALFEDIEVTGEAIADRLNPNEMMCVHPFDPQTENRPDRCTCFLGPLDKAGISGGGLYGLRRVAITRGSAEDVALDSLADWTPDILAAGRTPCTPEQMVVSYDGGVFKPQPRPTPPPLTNQLSLPAEITTILFRDQSQTNVLNIHSDQTTAWPLAGEELLERHGIPRSLYCPRYSPDRQQIVMAIYGVVSSGIYLANADGSEPKLLIHRHLAHTDGYPLEAVWSPDGRKILFSDEGKIYLVDAVNIHQSIATPWLPRNSDWKISPDAQLIHLTRDGGHPDWSPDGQQIIFSTYSAHRINKDIYLISRLDEGPQSHRELKQLTEHPDNDWYPRWAPDGAHIIFLSDRDGQKDIYMMKPDGSDKRRLTNTPETEIAVSWSPDSRHILYASVHPNRGPTFFDIYLLNIADNSGKLLVKQVSASIAPTECQLPTWSPDGNYIAFTDLRKNRYFNGSRLAITDLYVLKADGSNLTKVLTWPDRITGLAW